MQKRFCDICEKPALENPGVLVSENWGLSREQYPHGHASKPEMFQPQIVVTANFSFHKHPTGFGGPPDLCGECRRRLLCELVKVASGKEPTCEK